MPLPTMTADRSRTALAAGAVLLALAGCSSDEIDSATPEIAGAADVTTTTVEASDDALESDTDTQTEEAEVDAADDTAASAPEAEPTESDVADDTDDETVVGDGVITDIVADASGGRSTFDGTVDEVEDLEALVVDAWGDGGLGLHRGHAQVENVLEAFLGINHDEMHDYMDDGFNLGDLAVELGRDPDDLVETLTASYAPYVNEGVANGVITEVEAAEWIDLLRTEFNDRVYWDGVSES